jgi:inner membrane protein
MPSPIGHGLAGLAIGFAAEPATTAQTTGRRLSRFAVLGAVFAALPDADLLYAPIHRGVSHSIGATALLMIIAALVTGWVTGRVQWRWVLLIGAAHGSHILMDWMGTDRYPPPGLEALWPFSRNFYISGWDVFPPTERRIYLPGAWWTNLRALVAEVGLMLPIAALTFVARRTRKSRVPTSAPDSLQRPSV